MNNIISEIILERIEELQQDIKLLIKDIEESTPDEAYTYELKADLIRTVSEHAELKRIVKAAEDGYVIN